MQPQLRRQKLFRLLWLIPLLIGAAFRLTGLQWDSLLMLHPDERFLVQVSQAVRLPNSISAWLNPRLSPMNPANLGFSFYVYGDFPLLWVKLLEAAFQTPATFSAGEWLLLLGRASSVFFDLLTLLCVGFLTARLTRSRWALIFAMGGYAVFVGTIQQAHFFTVDAMAGFFCALYTLIVVLWLQDSCATQKDVCEWLLAGVSGMVGGIALSCKLSAAFFLLLPLLFVLVEWATRKRINWARLSAVLFSWLVSALFFRLFQPYAFAPGTFFVFDAGWLASLRELTAESGGLIQFPPAWQWVNRPATFALQNLALYGLGIPLALLLVSGWSMAAVRAVRNRERTRLSLLLFCVLFIGWQCLQFSKMMRYLLPLCPLLFALAAAGWWDGLARLRLRKRPRWAAYMVLGVLAAAALAYAVAFSAIYAVPHTRVQASQWIYNNARSALTLTWNRASGEDSEQPVAVPASVTLDAAEPALILPVRVQTGDAPRMLDLDDVQVQQGQQCAIDVSLCADFACANPLQTSRMIAEDGTRVVFPQDSAFADEQIYIRLELVSESCAVRLQGNASLYLMRAGSPRYVLADPYVRPLQAGTPLAVDLKAEARGTLRKITLNHAEAHGVDAGAVRLSLTLTDYATGTSQTRILKNPVVHGIGLEFALDEGLPIEAAGMIKLRIDMLSSRGAVTFHADRIATETSWDDRLPLRMAGLNPYDPTYGLYGAAVDLDLFAREDLLQREMLLSKIAAADLLVISSNRVSAAATRAPENFPLLEPFYKLVNSGEFFDRTAVFESEPQLGNWTFLTQKAEEAFTVYDHPRVMIFQKRADFDLDVFRQSLDAVNLSAVSDKIPVEYKGMDNAALFLTQAQTTIQQAGGTWSDLFNRASILNQQPALAAIVWYLVFWLIGVIFFPTTRRIFGSLRDKGYGVSRFFGLILLGYILWFAGFQGIAYSRLMITLTAAALAALNLILFLRNREAILRELRQSRRTMFQSEIVFLSCFLFFLLIRLGNPDLWHPSKGGEKPMDFSYFNAVLKSTIFPPYDPWFSGGTLNYYYYGFFLSGIVDKWLGIFPSIAYNLILPMWYAFLGVGAFTVGSNLYARTFAEADAEKGAGIAGAVSVLFLQVFGNQGTLGIIGKELVELGGNGAEPASVWEGFTRFFVGIAKLIQGQHFQMYPGDWYWIPSRAIPGEPITEFPYFTFLYGDPHAHLFALPLTMLALVWLTAWIFSRDAFQWKTLILKLIAGALILGSLIPTNTWDLPTYLLIACFVIAGGWFFAKRFSGETEPKTQPKLAGMILCGVLLAGLTVALFIPYLRTNSRESGIDVWNDTRTPLWSYLMHWGLFLFALISWYWRETLDWLGATRLGAFRAFVAEKRLALICGAILFCAALIACSVEKVWVAWVALPMMAWSLILILREPGKPGKRFLYFLGGTAFFITLFVEFFCLRGDLGRMNMVFKLYLQAWVLFSVPAAMSIVYLLRERSVGKGASVRANLWLTLLGILIIGAGSYPIFASIDKIRDRISSVAPHTLDGMAYMQTSQYYQDGFLMDLSQDYAAIQWMQDHVAGSLVIVEGNATEYKWGNRYTVYTGLPSVVGWNYHQRQQRGLISDQVWERVNAITSFYNDPDALNALRFLKQYNVSYIIVGQMERGMYAPEGIAKFAGSEGLLWSKVYEAGDTVIYQVLKESEYYQQTEVGGA